MHTSTVAAAAAALLLQATATAAKDAETILGVYIFHRHGDRTAKAWKPVNLTALGQDEVHSSGAFYHDRYVNASGIMHVQGLNSDFVNIHQVAVSSPVDAVLHDSALAFVQGVYPPVGRASETLANGTKVTAPLDGYQYVPINAVEDAASGDNSEQTTWLQGSSDCPAGEVSSNNYLKSDEYATTYADSKDLYQSLLPVYESTFSADEANFKNAYAIWDYINVGQIHNTSIPNSDLITNDTMSRLFGLASTHQWNLAYNSTDPVRAITGAVLAGQVVEALEPLVNGKQGAPALNIQFGSYGTFMSFFGMAQMQKVSDSFKNVCNYASSMTFELVTNATDPKPEDVSVRFYFANGTTARNPLMPYPLFGQDTYTLPWNEFKASMTEFAVENDADWCKLCNSDQGICAANATSSGGDAYSNSSDDSGSGGISKAVCGVIGALVTLGVILGLEAAVMLVGGLRLVKKSTLASAASAGATTGSAGGAKA